MWLSFQFKEGCFLYIQDHLVCYLVFPTFLCDIFGGEYGHSLFPASMLSRSRRWRADSGPLLCVYWVNTMALSLLLLTLCIGGGVNAHFGRQ